jgi:hypothetical protein
MDLSQEELTAKLNTVVNVNVGKFYYHWKDDTKLYYVMAIGLNKETLEPVIIYRAQYGNNIVWTRSYSDWNQSVSRPDNDGNIIVTPRFTPVLLPTTMAPSFYQRLKNFYYSMWRKN